MIKFNPVDVRALTAAISRALSRTLKAVALHTQSVVAKYPPRVPNKSKYTSYERGRGLIRLRDGQLLQSSQLLNRRWRIEKEGGSEVIANNASYAQFVHGDYQAHWHATNGWQKADTVAKKIEKSGLPERVFQTELKKEGY